jgi:uncharacterized protein YbjQ (UPF0145 family)
VIVTTTNDVAGHTITSYLGVVRGIVVRAPSISQNFAGNFQGIFGGNIDAFTQVCEEARREAYERMVAHAQQIGAHAVIGMRYDATEFSERATEVLAYGTAVQFREPPAAPPEPSVRKWLDEKDSTSGPQGPVYIQ